MAGLHAGYGAISQIGEAHSAQHAGTGVDAAQPRRWGAAGFAALVGAVAAAAAVSLVAVTLTAGAAQKGEAARLSPTVLAAMNLAANNGGLALGNTALAQRMKEQCPCAIAGNTMLSQQVLKECPCASAVAAAVTKALNDALMTSSANDYAYARSSPGVPPQPLTAEIGQAAYPPGVAPQAVAPSYGPTPYQAAMGQVHDVSQKSSIYSKSSRALTLENFWQESSYMGVIQTLTRDVVADANMIRDLQSQQEQLLRQQNTVANQIDTFQAQVLKSTLLLPVRSGRVLGHSLFRISSRLPKRQFRWRPPCTDTESLIFQNIIKHPSIYITYYR